MKSLSEAAAWSLIRRLEEENKLLKERITSLSRELDEQKMKTLMLELGGIDATKGDTEPRY